METADSCLHFSIPPLPLFQANLLLLNKSEPEFGFPHIICHQRLLAIIFRVTDFMLLFQVLYLGT